jgi:beta-mannosidase
MIIQTLAGPWQFRQVGGEEWLPATVPGSVHADLLAAGRIPDPFVGENETAVQWVADQDWEYRREFSVAAELLAHERVTLVCAGLDTLAEVALNGRPLGATDNMFREYRWEVKPLLREGANTLTIVFRSPTAYIRARQAARRLPAAMGCGASHLRKAPSHFGWDWGPCRVFT